MSTHESTPTHLLYKSPTPKHLLILEIIQNKINRLEKGIEIIELTNEQVTVIKAEVAEIAISGKRF